MEASAAGARAHRSVRAGQAVRVCLLVSLPMLELPVFSEGVWGGKRALRWDVGVWWGTGVRWDPSHVEGTAVVTLTADVADDVLKNVVEAQDYKVISVN